MNFKDLFQRYVEGQANPDEMELVEEEIKKYELINEYLADNINLESLKNIEDGNAENGLKEKEDRKILEEIQKVINKNFRRTAIKSTVFVLIILGIIQFVLSPLINLIYYNSLRGKDDSQRQLLVDMVVFTELHFAGVVTDHAEAEPLGFGNYNIKIDQRDSFSDTLMFEGKIERGKLKYMQRDFYKYTVLSAFRYGDYYTRKLSPKEIEEPYDNLKAMPETAIAKVYVSFNEDISIEEVASIMSYGKNKFRLDWIAVRTAPKSTQQIPQLGFQPYEGGVLLNKDAINEEKYPYLELGYDPNSYDLYEIMPHSSEILKTHFKSLIKYMSDNKDLVKMLQIDEGTKVYNRALDYIEKNGIKSYGALVIGDAHEIAKLRENPKVDSILIDNAKLSIHTK